MASSAENSPSPNFAISIGAVPIKDAAAHLECYRQLTNFTVNNFPRFLPARRQAIAVFAVIACVCLSVRPSVCHKPIL